MTIVNEKISKEDWEKYNLKKLDERLPWSTPATCWTIDREKESWIRYYYMPIDRDEGRIADPTIYDYWWKDTPLVVEACTKDSRIIQKNDKEYSSKTFEIVSIELTNSLKPEQNNVLKELSKLFEVYQYLYIGTHPYNVPINRVDLSKCQLIYR